TCVHGHNDTVGYFFFQAEDGIRDFHVTGVQTCALPIYLPERLRHGWPLAAPDASRFFGGEAAGYTDYPIFTAQKARTPATAQERSEERHVGKECRSRWESDN